MKIPEEVLTQYNISLNHLDDEEGMYRTFLLRTDYEIIKGFETLLKEPLKLLTSIVELAKTLKSVCEYRTVAREELEKINESR